MVDPLNTQAGSAHSSPETSPGEPAILIADDDPTTRDVLRHRFQNDERLADARILEATSIPDAVRLLSQEQVHVAILDKRFEDAKTGEVSDGIDAIPGFLAIKPDLQVLVFSGAGDTQDIVRAIQSGAINYFSKNEDSTLMNSKIARALQIAQLALSKTHTERGGVLETGMISLPGKSHAIRRLSRQLEAAATNHLPVLLLGESGVGKTRVARAIHEFRCIGMNLKSRPFYAVNISALAANIVESELFGHAKGAFSGAIQQHQGFFELVNGGTFFIDEIGDLSLDIQGKLLKVLDEHVFYRVGSTKELRTHFKPVFATNKDLEELVRQGKFREDLYFRICTLTVNVPSVRDRRGDMPDLIQAVLPKVCRDADVFIAFEDIPASFISALAKSPPPGNIRGIEAALSHLLIFSPKNKFGKPHLERWKGVRELAYLHGGIHADGDEVIEPSVGGLTLEEISKRSFDVVGPRFSGLANFLDLVREKIALDALSKSKNQTEAAKSLQISVGSMSKFASRVAPKKKST